MPSSASSLRIAHAGHCFGPILGRPTVRQAVEMVVAAGTGTGTDVPSTPSDPPSDAPRQSATADLTSLALRRIGETHLWTVVDDGDAQLPEGGGIYEVVKRLDGGSHARSAFAVDTVATPSIINSSSSSTSPLIAYLLDDLATVMDTCMGSGVSVTSSARTQSTSSPAPPTGLAHIDASRMSEKHLKVLRASLLRVERVLAIIDGVPSRRPEGEAAVLHHELPPHDPRWKAMQTLADALHAELWQTVHRRKRPLEHLTFVPLPDDVTSTSTSRSNNKLPLRYEPSTHKPVTNRLLARYGLIGDDTNEHSEDESGKVQMIAVDDAVSWLRVRLCDAMLSTGIYRRVDMLRLLNTLAAVEERRLTGWCGTSRCHGVRHWYPREAVVERLVKEFAL